jgi:hypothetical protein
MAPKHGAPWSLNEIAQLKSMVARQIALKEIGAHLGRTEEAVTGKLYSIGGSRARQPGKRQQRRRNGAAFFLS